MYSSIDANKRKTVWLMAIVSALIIALGYLIGISVGDQSAGIIVAVLFSTTITLVSYFYSDKLALASSGAKPLRKEDHLALYRLVENLCITGGLPMPQLYLIHDPSPNAFATGRDPQHAAVAVTTGLLTILDKQELEGVLAHELSHVKNWDIRVMTVTVVMVGAVMLLADLLLRIGFRRDDNSGQAALALALVGLVLSLLSPLLAQLIKLAISRSREYLADASGALLTRYPDGLARALEKIAAHDRPLRRANHATAHLFLANPFDPHVTSRFERWFSTHPPIEERIAKLRGMAV